MKKFLSTLMMVTLLFGIVGVCTATVSVPAYSEEVVPSSSGSLSELTESVAATMEEGTSSLVRFAKAGCVLVMAIAFIVLMFSRDRQKTSLTISMIITAGLGFLGFLAVTNKWFISFIENIGTKYFHG